MIITYVGKSDVRRISSADLAAHGLSSSTLQWDRSNGLSLDVPPDVGAFLLAQGEFIAESGAVFGDVLGGGGGSAASTTATPAGSLVGNTVEAQLYELDAEKAPLAAPAFTGTATFAGPVDVTGHLMAGADATLDPPLFGQATKYVLHVRETITGNTVNNGVMSSVILDPVADVTKPSTGVRGEVVIPSTSTRSMSGLNGASFLADAAGSGNCTALYGVSSTVYLKNSRTAGDVYGIYSNIDILGSGNVGNVWGVFSIFESDATNYVTGDVYLFAAAHVMYGAGITNRIYAYYEYPPDKSGTVNEKYGVWLPDYAGISPLSYYSWFDSRGVLRVREDDAVDPGFPQAVQALYNPRFAKYTAGAVNHERIVLGQWRNDVAEVGTEYGGTGVARPLALVTGGEQRVVVGDDGAVVIGSPVNDPGITALQLLKAPGQYEALLRVGEGEYSSDTAHTVSAVIEDTRTDTTGYHVALFAGMTLQPATNSTKGGYAVRAAVGYDSSFDLINDSVIGGLITSFTAPTATGDIDSGYGMVVGFEAHGAGLVGKARGVHVVMPSTWAVGTTITDAVGLYVGDYSTTDESVVVNVGTITNSYGIVIANLSAGPGTHTNPPWGIYQVSDEPSRLGSVVQVVRNVASGSDYGYQEVQLALRNPDAATPVAQIYGFGSEGEYHDNGTIVDSGFYIYDYVGNGYVIRCLPAGTQITRGDLEITTNAKSLIQKSAETNTRRRLVLHDDGTVTCAAA